MADTLSPAERSEPMGRVRSKDTKPEPALQVTVASVYPTPFHYARVETQQPINLSQALLYS